ncbi:MAG: HD domain-containing protein [Alphaproteobacteria bacterium]|nr:HD domain-containing protein [Alphaproteobacteria bacterium]
MDTIKRILEKHYQKNLLLCEKDEKNRRYIQDKYAHAYRTLECGQAIAPADIAADTLAAVLLLHDIGRFYEHLQLADFKHAEYGVRLLKDEGFTDMNILLPVKYHETDDWQTALAADDDYQKLPAAAQNNVRLLCRILIDADIIDNMQILAKTDIQTSATMSLTTAITDCLLADKPANNKDVHNRADAIVYILCGLALINLEKSRQYLQEKHIVQNLVQRLFELAANNAALQNDVCEIRDKINETYHFQI